MKYKVIFGICTKCKKAVKVSQAVYLPPYGNLVHSKCAPKK